MTTATRGEAPRHFSTSVMKSYVFTLCEDISVFHYISFITLFELFVLLPPPPAE